jgi:hypothetical protein
VDGSRRRGVGKVKLGLGEDDKAARRPATAIERAIELDVDPRGRAGVRRGGAGKYKKLTRNKLGDLLRGDSLEIRVGGAAELRDGMAHEESVPEPAASVQARSCGRAPRARRAPRRFARARNEATLTARAGGSGRPRLHKRTATSDRRRPPSASGASLGACRSRNARTSRHAARGTSARPSCRSHRRPG